MTESLSPQADSRRDGASDALPAPDGGLRALRFFRHIAADDPWIGSRSSLSPRDAERFPGDNLAATFARALCERRAIPVKELFEAVETFALVRKVLRARALADLCCGHGLGGVLFALMERQVDRVLLIDRERPPSADKVLAAAADVAPWVAPKIEWRETQLKRVTLDPGTAVLAIHACGLRTDTAIDMALQSRGPFAALPCCRPHSAHPAPLSLKNALGADIAIDVHRTYALEAQGYRVSWKDISKTITPKNRTLIAKAPPHALAQYGGRS